MESGLRPSDFDHIVSDPSGIKGVKDGKEYPISQEEYDRMHPKHNGCDECTFVANAEFIYVLPAQIESCKLSLRDLASLNSKTIQRNWERKIVSLGKFYLPGWTGHLNFFLFQCLGCNETSVDYIHGRRPHITCQHCVANWDIKSNRILCEAGYKN